MHLNYVKPRVDKKVSKNKPMQRVLVALQYKSIKLEHFNCLLSLF